MQGQEEHNQDHQAQQGLEGDDLFRMTHGQSLLGHEIYPVAEGTCETSRSGSGQDSSSSPALLRPPEVIFGVVAENYRGKQQRFFSTQVTLVNHCGTEGTKYDLEHGGRGIEIKMIHDLSDDGRPI